MNWVFWIFICLAFIIGLVLGLFADGYKYNTGYKNGLGDKENELIPMIKRLQEELEEQEKKTVINGVYPIKEEKEK